ncbi:MAG: trypsin-like peptidase domain-containing protein [Victivallales bacterium]|nr:trypsin-like peptidase domain-containing protein [Victivallales bacterium]
MSENNWRSEREKYKVLSQKGGGTEKTTEPQGNEPQNPPTSPNGGEAWKIVVVLVFLMFGLAALIVSAVYVFGKGRGDDSNKSGKTLLVNEGSGSTATTVVAADSAKKLQEVVDRHQHAVGLVVFWATLETGDAITEPVGTAWACAPDKFATNAHVAQGLSMNCRKLLVNLGCRIILAEIEKTGALKKETKDSQSAEDDEDEETDEKKLEAYREKIGKDAFAAKLNTAVNLALKNIVKDMGVEIRINGKNNVSIPVTMVQVHRKYGMPDTNFDPDVAMLIIGSTVDDYFPLAKRDSLKNMKQGMPIAFLGYPMENLYGGNVNLESPGATMQTGIVSAMSDFTLKDVGFEGNYLIRHNLPTAGGASGSPLFNADGEVVALVFGGNMELKKSQENVVVGRTLNAAQVNFGVRVDLLDGMGDAVSIDKWLLGN